MAVLLDRPVVLFTNSPYIGGMEEHVLQLAAGLVELGLSVAVVCSPQDAIAPLRRDLTAAGVDVKALAERDRGPFGPPRRLAALARTVRDYPNCVMHLHLTGHSGGVLPALAARLGGASAVLRTEHLPPVPPIGTRDRVLASLRDRLVDRVICVSQQTRQAHLDELGRDANKLVVVPNCVDLVKFAPRPADPALYAELGIEPGAPIVGTVSRLGEDRKGIAYFLEMAARVALANPETHFLIVGDGPLRPALEQQARRLGIAGLVRFTGERPTVPPLLAMMDVFVMPSLYEGGPYTVLEALAMGIPVVATPVGLVPDVIEHGVSGRLVPPADGGALAQAVLVMLADRYRAREMARRGRQYVVRHYSREAMLRGILDVYSEASRAVPGQPRPI